MADQIRRDVTFHKEHFSDGYFSAVTASAWGRLRKPLGAQDRETREEAPASGVAVDPGEDGDRIDWKVFRTTERFPKDRMAVQRCVRIELKFRGVGADADSLWVDLPRGQFNRLSSESMNPQYLVLVVGAPDPEAWLDEGGAALGLCARAYWTSLIGATPERSRYSGKVRVGLDPRWRFSREVMDKMLWAATRYEVLTHD